MLRGASFADGRAASPRRNVSLAVSDGRVLYLGPRDGEPDPRGAEIIDVPGATIVPGLVDAHVHLTGLGGPDYIARFGDPEPELLSRAERIARETARAGILAVRDVGAPRALNLRARDQLRGQREAPVILAAGTWIARRGTHVSFAVQVSSATELRDAGLAQLDAGADLVKIVLDDPSGRPTFSANELRPLVEAVHARGKRIAAHAQGAGAVNGVEAGVDTIDHGFAIDAPTAARMRGRVALVSTLSVLATFASFAESGSAGWAGQRAYWSERLEGALAAIAVARKAGVRIAAGTDQGGGGVAPARLASEVALLVRAGLAPHEALASATWVGGEVLGVPGAGTLAAGAPADFLVVRGDPLSDVAALERIAMVFRAGARIA